MSDEGRLSKSANAFNIGLCTVSTIVRLMEEVENFYSRYEAPQCIGAIDGNLIDIRAPTINSTDYINRKSQCSLNVQACFGFKYCFLNVVIKWPGNPAYPLLPHLMKEYVNGGSLPQAQYFWYQICSARNVIECSFGRLKARFGVLKCTMDMHIQQFLYVIYAYFALHNYCEQNHESICEDNV
uniref:DDE Tnp4 domain-containing protein n=1 Tax=Amphimedon queenslandica TaxID=400682 RepID=A0A1X7TJY4_AMPQE